MSDPCFVACIILSVIQPKKITQDHLWQKVLVLVLDLDTAIAMVNKKQMGTKTEKPTCTAD
jgi:hypothetical protein